MLYYVNSGYRCNFSFQFHLYFLLIYIPVKHISCRCHMQSKSVGIRTRMHRNSVPSERFFRENGIKLF